MRVRKWLMKQQWRVVQIRGIWSLFYGTLLLAMAYVGYVPVFSVFGAAAPFVFAVVILIVLLILGYIYDRVLVLWAASQEVVQERNPFQYVPGPKDHIFTFPIYSTVLDAMEQLGDRFGVDTSLIKETREYFAKFERFRPERREDIDEALKLRQEFLKKHPLISDDELELTRAP